MQSRIIRIAPEDLVRLMTHYSDGAVPPDAEVREIGYSQFMQRMIGILVRSENWNTDLIENGGNDLYPLHFRYEGRRTMSWEGPRHAEMPTWTGEVEAPTRQ